MYYYHVISLVSWCLNIAQYCRTKQRIQFQEGCGQTWTSCCSGAQLRWPLVGSAEKQRKTRMIFPHRVQNCCLSHTPMPCQATPIQSSSNKKACLDGDQLHSDTQSPLQPGLIPRNPWKKVRSRNTTVRKPKASLRNDSFTLANLFISKPLY